MNTIRKYWLLLFIAASLVYVVFFASREIQNIEWNLRISYGALATTLLIQTLFWVLTSYLWRKIVFGVSAVRLSFLESFSQLSLVTIGKYLPGKVWGIFARASHMKQYHGIRIEFAAHATYLEQYFLLSSSIVTAALLAAALLDVPWVRWLGFAALVGVVVEARYNDRVLAIILFLYNRLKGEKGKPISTFSVPWSHYYQYQFIFSMVWLLLGAVLIGLQQTFFAGELSIRMAGMLILASTAAYAVGFLAIFAPGGIGVREAVSSAILASQMSVHEAVLLSVLFRIWTIAVEFSVGGAAILLTRRQAAS